MHQSRPIPQALKQFAHALDQLKLETRSDAAATELIKPLLQPIITQDDWLPSWAFETAHMHDGEAAYVVPTQNHAYMLLLVVWQSGIKSCIHDHHTWSVVGVLKGQETISLYTASNETDETHDNHIHLIEKNTQQLNPGDIICADADAIHQVANTSAAGELAISLHIYGADLRQVERYNYDPLTHTRSRNPNSEFVELN